MTRLGGHGLGHVFHRARSDFFEVMGAWTDSTGSGDAGAAAVVELADPTGERAGRWLNAVGRPMRLARLLATVVPDGDVVAATVTRGTGALAQDVLSGWGLGSATTWDRMVTEVAPPVPEDAAPAVEVLDLDRHADEIADLLAEANPHARLGVHDPRARRARWYGMRDPSAGSGRRSSTGAGRRAGSLVAVGSATPVPAGTVHLGSIGTLPAFRGRGYAGVLTARMTADGVAERGLVTLGLYDDNVPARRVYERLGFVVAHEVETWRSG
ncbi:FR47-like protein [Promicromonospora sp. AC04]|uniref:GNAT family N-acetyltransferase n=1 Tax=Promicromonospora sp. AC04 TaxID=2135723 RepID=UPI000D3694E4|nr:GNAT family N-acetyltransferase [Promicromonospora sp. AC04]PUB25412.1 FR47-like protein [Promicromonospora sp. AC04]